MKRFLFLLFLVFGACFSSVSGGAAELIMLESPGCVWCERWHREIGPAYPKTEEGKRARLRRVDISDPLPDDLKNLRKEWVTPTFILMEEGKEVDRLRGYPGEDFFWPLLGEMLEKLPKESG